MSVSISSRGQVLLSGVDQTTQLDRRSEHQALEEQLQFERLIADLTGRFVNIPADEVDPAIEDTQRLICEHLELDRATLFQFGDWGTDLLMLTHMHQAPDEPRWEKRPGPSPFPGTYWIVSEDQPPILNLFDVKALFPWVFEQLRDGRTLVMSQVDDLPEQAAADRAAFRQYQILSSVVVPLSAGGRWLGCLSFAAMRGGRHWTDQHVRRFEFLAGVMADILAWRRGAELVRESDERLQLATASAGVGLWSLSAQTRQVWVTDKSRHFFGFSPGEVLTDEHFLAKVHPEDRLPVRQAVEHALQTGTDLGIDCRIASPQGDHRWIVVRGRPHRIPGGPLQCLLGVAVDITDRKRDEAELHRTLDELKRLKQQLEHENVRLRKEARPHHAATEIIGSSAPLIKVIRQAEQVATTDSTALILGETGTGKELLAQYIHRISRRSSKTFVATNIAAIPSTLLESELFGREKGAYTGALTKEIGRFELADGGTLFLDEIGEMPLDTQAKLLRVLQTGQFERLGSGRPLRVDVRVIAATNRKLPDLIKSGLFRQDLYYRLDVFPITLPPLRDRPTDIPLLVWAFVKELSEKMGKAFDRIRKKDLDSMQSYDWPGNVRELRNVVERSMIMSEGPELRLALPDRHSDVMAGSSRRLVDVQKEHILLVLESAGNKVHGAGGAAEILGLKPSTLYSLMARLGIPRTR